MDLLVPNCPMAILEEERDHKRDFGWRYLGWVDPGQGLRARGRSSGIPGPRGTTRNATASFSEETTRTY